MEAAVRLHDALQRDAIHRHGGFIFKTVGDAFCCVFARPEDAVLGALAVQRVLLAQDFSAVGGLSVRMALHSGTADERDGDYFGPALNRVARLLSIGHGGQVLLSNATRAIVRDDLPAGATLADLGSQTLKDLAQPEQVWQLDAPDLRSEFPPLKSLNMLRNNLPIQRTSFVGRERDVAEIKELISRHNLLTLFGAGGIGKTRMATQVGADLIDTFPDGVWFADFAPITDPELVASVLGKVVGINQAQGKRVDESIAPWLKRKKMLLILDNCEHVLKAVAAIADAILEAAPDVKLLITSRQALSVAGEEVVQLSPLAAPLKTENRSPEELMEFGAVALFVDRARSVNKSFKLTDETAPIVADICRRLDGLALAIELAAARANVLSIPSLARHLDERLKLLTAGSRTASPRQKTLGALIDWSYNLLSPPEQTLFIRLGCFAGGFSLDAARAVCVGDEVEDIGVFDLLTSLTEKSLVVAETSGECERFRLLDSTRAYALDKLKGTFSYESLMRRHAKYFANQALAAEQSYGPGSSLSKLTDLELEIGNFRAMLEWALTQGNDVVLGGTVAGALRRLWRDGGLAAEGRWWIGAALGRLAETEHPAIVARLWLGVAVLNPDKRGYEAAEHARSLYESVNDRPGVAEALSLVSFALCWMGRLDEAAEINERALAEARAFGATSRVAYCLNTKGFILSELGDPHSARDAYMQALSVHKALGNEIGVSVVLSNLAECAFRAGDAQDALRQASESLAIRGRGKSTRDLAMYHNNIAAYRIALSDLDGARESARQGVHTARQAQSAMMAAVAFQHLALVAALGGEPDRAARLLAYVDATYKDLRQSREFTERWGYEKLTSALREQLDSAELAKLFDEGTTWSEDRAVEEALRV